jgi:hypothetical protein
MRSTDYFINKAKEYIDSIDELLQYLHPVPTQTQEAGPEYREQPEKIAAIRLKTSRLFLEFDSNEIFQKNIAAIDRNRMIGTDEEEILDRYKYTLSIFIDHLTEPAKNESLVLVDA